MCISVQYLKSNVVKKRSPSQKKKSKKASSRSASCYETESSLIFVMGSFAFKEVTCSCRIPLEPSQCVKKSHKPNGPYVTRWMGCICTTSPYRVISLMRAVIVRMNELISPHLCRDALYTGPITLPSSS